MVLFIMVLDQVQHHAGLSVYRVPLEGGREGGGREVEIKGRDRGRKGGREGGREGRRETRIE